MFLLLGSNGWRRGCLPLGRCAAPQTWLDPRAGRTIRRGRIASARPFCGAAFPRPLPALLHHHRAPPALLCLREAATAQRAFEPAWHRRQRRARGWARTLTRLGAAANLLSGHHSAQPHQAMGRWQNGRSWEDGDGWRTVRHDRGGGRGGSRQRSGSNNRPDGSSSDLRQENRRLKDKLAAAERVQAMAHDKTPHPGAVERPREGDWLCSNLACGFGSNRHARLFCYKCAQPRALSFPSATGAGLAGTSLSTPSPTTTSLRPGQAPPSPAPPSVVLEQASPQERAKSLRSKLELLKSARSLFEGNPECSAQLQKCDDDIAEAQGLLAACVPVEVAVKSTIAPASQARSALHKAEAKLAKLEAQVIGAVAAYDAAAVEVEDCRQKLAAAEAATARAAASSLPHSDLVAAMARDPAAVWEAMLASIEVRTPGMPEGLLQHLRATTSALKQICAMLPEEPTVMPVVVPVDGKGHSAAPAGGTAQPAPPAPAPATPILQPASPQASGTSLSGQQPQIRHSAPTGHAGGTVAQPSMEELRARLREAQDRVEAQEVQLASFRTAAAAASPGSSGTASLQPSAPGIPSQFEVVAAAAAAAEAADLCREAEVAALVQPQPPPAEALVTVESPPAPLPAAAAPPLEGGPAESIDAEVITSIADVDASQPTAAGNPSDDIMGGASPHVVARKRAAEAIEEARGLAAKAKAKSKSQ